MSCLPRQSAVTNSDRAHIVLVSFEYHDGIAASNIPMKPCINIPAIALTASLIAACASVTQSGEVARNGKYAPGCMAMAGDTIELDDGRFVWDKFTDAVKLGADGKKEDAYPAHPMHGNYEVSGNKLVLKPDAGGVTSVFYLVNEGGDHYVLNVVQHSQWLTAGTIPACALIHSELPGH